MIAANSGTLQKKPQSILGLFGLILAQMALNLLPIQHHPMPTVDTTGGHRLIWLRHL